MQVKSVLDPCVDENDDMQDDGKSTGPNSVHDEQPSDSDSEVNSHSSAFYSIFTFYVVCLKRNLFFCCCCFQISQTKETQFLVAAVGNDDLQKILV